MLAAAMIGGVIFQFPFGRLSDRIDRRYVMTLAGAIGMSVSMAMIVWAPRTTLGVVIGTFALGSVLLVIYSLGVAHANDQAEPDGFVQVSSGLLVVYGAGNMVGPQLGGRLMDGFGPEGFFIAMGAMFALYGAYAFWRTTRKPPPPSQLRSDVDNPTMLAIQTPATLELGPSTADLLDTPPQGERSTGLSTPAG